MTTKFYYIKHWEAEGIREIETDAPVDDRGCVYIRGDRFFGSHVYFLHVGKDAFTDESEAKAQVAVLLRRRIAAVTKKLKQLQGLTEAYPPKDAHKAGLLGKPKRKA